MVFQIDKLCFVDTGKDLERSDNGFHTERICHRDGQLKEAKRKLAELELNLEEYGND